MQSKKKCHDLLKKIKIVFERLRGSTRNTIVYRHLMSDTVPNAIEYHKE